MLSAGEVVAIPTETVYGLAGSIHSPEAIKKIFALKNRPFFDPLIVHIGGVEKATTVVKNFPPLAEKLSEKFWPGPLTMVLPKRDDLNPMITAGLDSVGIRIPSHPLTLQLLQQLGQPLAAPSANKFKRTSPTQVAHVQAEFGDDLCIVDGGDCQVGIESTVIGFNENFSEIFIYRAGAVTLEMLSHFAPTKYAPSPAAPGQLEHHYQPQIPLVLLTTTPYLTIEIYETLRSKLNLPHLHPSWMELPHEPYLAARELYSRMRQAAAQPFRNCILLPYIKNQNDDLWPAIHDRMVKAATVII